MSIRTLEILGGQGSIPMFSVVMRSHPGNCINWQTAAETNRLDVVGAKAADTLSFGLATVFEARIVNPHVSDPVASRQALIARVLHLQELAKTNLANILAIETRQARGEVPTGTAVSVIRSLRDAVNSLVTFDRLRSEGRFSATDNNLPQFAHLMVVTDAFERAAQAVNQLNVVTGAHPYSARFEQPGSSA